MSDVEVTYKEPLSRAETARCLSALATALADEGKVELELGTTRMKVHVPGEVHCKVEVEIDEDEIEFEVELTWSTTSPVRAAPRQEPTAEDHHANAAAANTHPTGRRKAAR
jgi:amphi-Trp domain-containing protein